MSEGQQMRCIALGMLLAAVTCALIFATTGLSLGWMLATAAMLMGAFMAFLLSFAALD